MPNIKLSSFFRFTVPCTTDAKHLESELESFIESQCHVTVEDWECELMGCKMQITITPFERNSLVDNQDFANAFADYTEWLAPVVPAVNKLSPLVMQQLCQELNVMLTACKADIRVNFNTSGVYAHIMGDICTRFYGVTYSQGEARIRGYINGYIDAISA